MGLVVKAKPRLHYSWERPGNPLYRRLGELQRWSVLKGAENLAPSGLNPRTVQAVASRYTD